MRRLVLALALLAVGCELSRPVVCSPVAEWPDPCAGAPTDGGIVDVPTREPRCLVVEVELDVEHGTLDDAGVWHYPSRDRSRWEPCP